MLKRLLRGIWADRRGQDTVEYALLCALFAMAAGATLAPVLDLTAQEFDRVVSVVELAVRGPGHQPPLPETPTVQSAQ